MDILPYIEQGNLRTGWNATAANNEHSQPNPDGERSADSEVSVAGQAWWKPSTRRITPSTETQTLALVLYQAGVSDYFCSSNSQAFESSSVQGMMPYLRRLSPARLGRVTDGLSNTVFLVEVEMAGGPVRYLTKKRSGVGRAVSLPRQLGGEQSAPLRPFDDAGTTSCSGNCVVNCSNVGSNLVRFHEGGSNAAFGDGSVRMIQRERGLTHRADYLIGRDDGQTVTEVTPGSRFMNRHCLTCLLRVPRPLRRLR